MVTLVAVQILDCVSRLCVSAKDQVNSQTADLVWKNIISHLAVIKRAVVCHSELDLTVLYPGVNG